MELLRLWSQEQVTLFGLAVLRLSQAAEAKPLLPASVAAVVHTAAVAGGTSIAYFVVLVVAGGHYTEDLWVRLLAAVVSAGASERGRCSGVEKALGLRGEMQGFLAFGAVGWHVRTQGQHAVIAGAYAAADGSVDMVDAAVGNSLVVGSAAPQVRLLLQNASPTWFD